MSEDRLEISIEPSHQRSGPCPLKLCNKYFPNEWWTPKNLFCLLNCGGPRERRSGQTVWHPWAARPQVGSAEQSSRTKVTPSSRGSCVQWATEEEKWDPALSPNWDSVWDSPSSKLPRGLAEMSIETALHPNFSLGQILLPSLPQVLDPRALPKNVLHANLCFRVSPGTPVLQPWCHCVGVMCCAPKVEEIGGQVGRAKKQCSTHWWEGTPVCAQTFMWNLQGGTQQTMSVATPYPPPPPHPRPLL